MADITLDNTAGGDASGDSWANASLSLTAALALAGDGGTIWMAPAHTEALAANTIYTSGTVDAVTRLICCADNTTYPPTAAGTQTGAGFDNSLDFNFEGYMYIYGCTFDTNDDIKIIILALDQTITFENCTIKQTGTSSGDAFQVGNSRSTTQICRFIDTTITFGSVGHGFWLGGACMFEWLGGALLTTNVTRLFETISEGTSINIRDVDLSVLSGSLIAGTSLTSAQPNILLERCKLHADFTVLSDSIDEVIGIPVRVHRCTSANNTYEFVEEWYEGRVEEDIANYLNATDGTVPFSIKMSPNTKAQEFIRHFTSPPIAAWTDATTEKTFTIEIISDVTLQDDEIWMELEYPGSDAQGLIATDRVADILTTPTNQTTSSAAWTETITSEVKQKLSVTVTPGKAGPITARVCLAAPSGTVTTVYIDPYITES